MNARVVQLWLGPCAPGSHLPGEMLKPERRECQSAGKAATLWGHGFSRQSLPVPRAVLLPGARGQNSKPKGSGWGGCSIPELPTPLQRGLWELWLPSPEQDEQDPPYPPAKKGDKPGALAQMLRDSFLAGGLKVGSCQFLLLDFFFLFGGNRILAEVPCPSRAEPRRGGGRYSIRSCHCPHIPATPTESPGLWEGGELLGGGCTSLDHHLLHPPEIPLTIPLEEKLKSFLLCCREARLSVWVEMEGR